MNLAEIARKAAEIASERGHCKRIEEDREGHVCFIGAVNIALCGEAIRPESVVLAQAAWDVMAAAQQVLRAEGNGYGTLMDSTHPIYWNNRESTTGEDVVLLLKKTAEALEAC